MPTTRAVAAEIEALYIQHGPALLLFATAMIGDRSRAQDVVHQVFLRLIEEGSLQRAANKRAYLFTCVRNAALNDGRLVRRTVSLEPDEPWFQATRQDVAAETSLRQSLVALSDDQRQIVVMHVWGELTFLEISELLEISPNTAASRYRYAIAKLRESMSCRRLASEATQNCSKENPCAKS